MVTSPFSYSYSNCALCTNLFDGRIRRKTENTKIVTWLLLCSPTNQQQLKRKGVIRLKGVRMKLEHSWSKAGKFRKYFMPRQHVASLKSHYAIPLLKVKNIYMPYGLAR